MSAQKKQRYVNRVARDIDRSAVFIEKRLILLQAIVKEIMRATEGLCWGGAGSRKPTPIPGVGLRGADRKLTHS